MARLPKVGSDNNTWGHVLNDFLLTEHNEDGTLKLRSENFVQTTGGVLPASVMRAFADRGVAQSNTSYSKWDTVVYNGRRILITAPYTSNSSGFISAANYVQLGGQHIYYAYDFGYRADGSQASAAANTNALQLAINTAAASNGGTIVLPFGYGFISGSLELKNRVWLQGSSTYGTVLQLADAANCNMVINHVSTNGTSDPNAMWCGVVNLTLDGRKSAQSGSFHGIYFNTNPFNTAASSDLAFDPTHLISNVHVRNTSGDGIHLNGRSDTRVSSCKSSFCNGYGFRSTFDTHFDHCISESSGLAGFAVQNSSVQFVGCKSYNSGQVTANGGHGFEVSGVGIGEITFAGCDAQQVKGYGFSITGSLSVAIEGCNVSQSSFGNGTAFCSYNLDAATYCTVNGTSQNTVAANALRLVNGASKNAITISHNGSGVGAVFTSDSVVLDNFVCANGSLLSSLAVVGSAGQNILAARTSASGNAFTVDQFGNAVAYQKLAVGGANAPHTFTCNGSFGFSAPTVISTPTVLGASQCVAVVNQPTTVTLPSATGASGRLYCIANTSNGNITVAAAASQTVVGNPTISIPSGGSIVLFAYGTDWLRFGNIV